MVKHVQIQQMGSIYLCADLTIIAAAGEDPAYGLAGISRPLIPDLPFFQRNIGHKPTESGRDYGHEQTLIHISKWSSRAWTFQERLLSHRALYFTDKGVLLRCRCKISSNMFEASALERLYRVSLGYLEDRITLFHLEQMCNVVKQYAHKDLSFDSDRLNAIVGVLNVFSAKNPSLGHIWGLPFQQIGTELIVALNWSQSSISERRAGFPSWSPLGWKTELCDFSPKDKQYIFDHESIYFGIWENNITHKLHCRNSDLPEFASQCLRVTALSVVVTKVYVTPRAINVDSKQSTCLHRDTSVPKGSYLIFGTHDQDGQSIIKYLKPRWDGIYLKNKGTSPELVCMFMSSHTDSSEGLVLKKCGSYYERIGCFVPFLSREMNGQELANLFEAAGEFEIHTAEAELRTFLIR